MPAPFPPVAAIGLRPGSLLKGLPASLPPPHAAAGRSGVCDGHGVEVGGSTPGPVCPQTFVSLPQWPGPASVCSHTHHSGSPCVHPLGAPARVTPPVLLALCMRAGVSLHFFQDVPTKSGMSAVSWPPTAELECLLFLFSGVGVTRAVRWGVHVQPGWAGVGQPDWQAGGRQGLGPAGELLAL